MKSSLKTLNTARQKSLRVAVSASTTRPINTAYPRPTVNCARPASNVFNRAHSHVRSPFNKFTKNKNSNFNEKVNTVRGNVTTVGPKAVVSDNKGNEANAVKASACWVWRPKQKVIDHGNPQLELQEKGVIYSGCSRHMTGNKSYLSDYEEIDGGFVAFRGSTKRGKITGKDTECVVLSSDFKLLDESQVLLRVPRKNNMYSVDLKNVVPSGGLTCLFAKATLDESNLWHRRLGHINFKTMNKLFCEKQGIKREFSVVRTPQQNRVAERKNRTLIKAARTMLADLKLPTTFWAETVNTTCYVQNRVLVIKPHNKTPYEIFHGRTPSLSFIRPFGCPVTILNILDHLGKFDGKADEGFFVGYSVYIKAFRVFNSRTRIVEETLHITFLENKPNVAGSTKESIYTGQAGKKIIPSHDYILLPLWTPDSPISSSPKRSDDEGRQDLRDEFEREFERLFVQGKEAEININNTNSISAISSPINTTRTKDVNDEPIMPNIGIFGDAYDDEDFVAGGDMNNLESSMSVSPIATTRVHKDHPVEQIIGDLHSAPQTRRNKKNDKEFRRT
ncbi:ribonuclease H-like domain-containing protein [Tanacetum coccineum]